MFIVDVRIDTSEVKKSLGNMSRKANIVMARAANRAAITGKRILKSETAEKYLVRQKDIDSLVTITKAYARKPYAKITYKDSHKNLAHWPLKSRNLSPYDKIIQFDFEGRPNVKVYKAQVMKNHGKQELGGKRKPFIQIAKKSGNIALFRRVSDGSNKIEGVSGPAFTQIIQNPDTIKKFNKETEETLSKRIRHEISLILNK